MIGHLAIQKLLWNQKKKMVPREMAEENDCRTEIYRFIGCQVVGKDNFHPRGKFWIKPLNNQTGILSRFNTCLLDKT